MYKVLLADDELWILAGLQAMIDWEGEGFTICATAENGILAEEKARQCNPDLILADIRMPGRDGLTLFRRLREAGCTALYAVISGYAEFSYAQECVRLGACGYLLKPVEEEELIALLRSARETLDRRYERQIMDELEEETGLIGRLFLDSCWITVVYGGDGEIAAPDAMCCRLSRSSRLYLSAGPLFSCEGNVPAGACAGAGRYRPDCDEPFAARVAACREASWQGFIQPGKRLFDSREIPPAASLPASAAPQALVQYCRAKLPQLPVKTLYLLYLTVQGYPEGIQPETPEWLLEHYDNAEQLLEKLEAELAACDEEIDDSVSVVAYLKEHFQEDLSLDAVSHALSMSISSVRRVLMRESGDTFQHCLIALRMEHARDLLKKGAQSINEVAYSSGFRDALYFRRVFKKWYGLTPSDFRSGLED